MEPAAQLVVDVGVQVHEAMVAVPKGETFFLLVEGGSRLKDPLPPFSCSNPPPSNVISVEDPTSTRNTKVPQLGLLSTIRANGLIRRLGVRSSASYSTPTLPAANEGSLVPTTIPVPSAEISHMVPQNVALNSIFPIVTKLKLDAWEHALRDAGILGEYSDIPAGLRNGFLCGLENFSLTCTSIPDNHYTLKEDENFIIKYAEMDLGRISHGYNPVTLFSLIGHF